MSCEIHLQQILSQVRINTYLCTAACLCTATCLTHVSIQSFVSRVYLCRSLSGEMSGDQCKCSHHDVTSTQLVVTRAVCCSNTRSHVSGSDSQLVQCPANLPHVSRYRSRKHEITCPAPKQPHKCVCLGEGYQTSRARGVISGNTCKCGSDTSVTRATCCHSEEQNKKFVIKLN